MSYTPKKSGNIINLKLTNLGRRQLTVGSLNFKSAVFSDKEINYSYFRNKSIASDLKKPYSEINKNNVNLFENNRILSPSLSDLSYLKNSYDFTSPVLLGAP